jgi:hypothetical protein
MASAIEGRTLNSNVWFSPPNSPLMLKIATYLMGSQQPGFPLTTSTSPTVVKSMLVFSKW